MAIMMVIGCMCVKMRSEKGHGAEALGKEQKAIRKRIWKGKGDRYGYVGGCYSVRLVDLLRFSLVCGYLFALSLGQIEICDSAHSVCYNDISYASVAPTSYLSTDP